MMEGDVEEEMPSSGDYSDELAAAEDKARVRAESQRVAADAEDAHALELFAEADYRAAEESLARTLELDPTHAEAQVKLNEVRRLLGRGPDGDQLR